MTAATSDAVFKGELLPHVMFQYWQGAVRTLLQTHVGLFCLRERNTDTYTSASLSTQHTLHRHVAVFPMVRAMPE
jgi:hypothetical protein